MTQYTLIVAVIVIMVISTVVNGQFEGRREFVDHHNYGYSLQKFQSIKVSTAEAQLVFHFQLPQRFNTVAKRINCRMLSNVTQALLCRRSRVVIEALQELRTKTVRRLGRYLDLIYDVLEDYTPESREKRGLWTMAWQAFTGLASEGDLQRLAEILLRVEQGVKVAADAWTSGTSHFTAAIMAERTRVNSIQRLMTMERESIRVIQRQIAQTMRQTDAYNVLLSLMLKEYIGPMILEVADIDDLYISLQILNNGRLAHKFVSHKKLREGLDTLNQWLTLRHHELTVAVDELAYYYGSSDFHVFRYGSHMVISLHVPLTLTPLFQPLFLAKVHKIPLLTPHDSTHYTMLTESPRWIAWSLDSPYYLTFEEFPKLRNNLLLDMRKSDATLQKLNEHSCATALIRGDLARIKSLCRYTIYSIPLPATVYHLSETTLLFSNISEIQITCDNKTITKRIDTLQFVYTAHCGCSLVTGKFYVPFYSLFCADNVTENVEVRHVINLPYLTEFFQFDIIAKLESNTLLNASVSAMLPELPIASAAYEHELQLQQDASFDLEVAINQSKSDKTMYKSLSHYLFNKLVEGQIKGEDFDVFNLFSWFCAIGIGLGILAFGGVIILHIRYKSLYLLAISRIPAADAMATAPFQFVFTKSTTQEPVDINKFYEFQRQLVEILPVDLTLLIILIFLLVGSFGYGVYRRYKKRRARTQIWLEISDGDRACMWPVMQLSFLPNHYRIEAEQKQTSVILQEGFLSAALVFSQPLEILNKVLDFEIVAPRKINVHWWQITTVRSILQSRHYIALLIFDGKEQLVSAVLLKGWRNQQSLTIPPFAGSLPNLSVQQLTQRQGDSVTGLYPQIPQY